MSRVSIADVNRELKSRYVNISNARKELGIDSASLIRARIARELQAREPQKSASDLVRRLESKAQSRAESASSFGRPKRLATTVPSEGGGTVTVTTSGLVTRRDKGGKVVERYMADVDAARRFAEEQGVKVEKLQKELKASKALESGEAKVISQPVVKPSSSAEQDVANVTGRFRDLQTSVLIADRKKAEAKRLAELNRREVRAVVEPESKVTRFARDVKSKFIQGFSFEKDFLGRSPESFTFPEKVGFVGGLVSGIATLGAAPAEAVGSKVIQVASKSPFLSRIVLTAPKLLKLPIVKQGLRLGGGLYAIGVGSNLIEAAKSGDSSDIARLGFKTLREVNLFKSTASGLSSQIKSDIDVLSSQAAKFPSPKQRKLFTIAATAPLVGGGGLQAVSRGGRRINPRSKAQIRKESFQRQFDPRLFRQGNELGVKVRTPELKQQFVKERVIRFGSEGRVVSDKGLRTDVPALKGVTVMRNRFISSQNVPRASLGKGINPEVVIERPGKISLGTRFGQLSGRKVSKPKNFNFRKLSKGDIRFALSNPSEKVQIQRNFVDLPKVSQTDNSYLLKQLPRLFSKREPLPLPKTNFRRYVFDTADVVSQDLRPRTGRGDFSFIEEPQQVVRGGFRRGTREKLFESLRSQKSFLESEKRAFDDFISSGVEDSVASVVGGESFVRGDVVVSPLNGVKPVVFSLPVQSLKPDLGVGLKSIPVIKTSFVSAIKSSELVVSKEDVSLGLKSGVDVSQIQSIIPKSDFKSSLDVSQALDLKQGQVVDIVGKVVSSPKPPSPKPPNPIIPTPKPSKPIFFRPKPPRPKPPRVNPPKPPKISDLSFSKPVSPLISEGVRSRLKSKLFDVFIRRKGRDVLFKSGVGRGSAASFLASELRGSLAASGFVVPRGGGKPLGFGELGFSSFGVFRPSKVDSFRVVQRRSTRLSSSSERSLIQIARREASFFVKGKGGFL